MLFLQVSTTIQHLDIFDQHQGADALTVDNQGKNPGLCVRMDKIVIKMKGNCRFQIL